MAYGESYIYDSVQKLPFRIVLALIPNIILFAIIHGIVELGFVMVKRTYIPGISKPQTIRRLKRIVFSFIH